MICKCGHDRTTHWGYFGDGQCLLPDCNCSQFDAAEANPLQGMTPTQKKTYVAVLEAVEAIGPVTGTKVKSYVGNGVTFAEVMKALRVAEEHGRITTDRTVSPTEYRP